MIEEVRAGFAALNHKFGATPEDGASSENRDSNSVSAGNKSTSPMPIFDGSEPLVWLARANQYFLVNKTSSDRRVDVAMLAIDGPAKPWKQLLVRRCPSLSWDKFVQELLQRFGDTITSGSCVAGNSSKYSTSADERTGLAVGVKTRLHDRGSACGFRGPQPQVQSNAGGRRVDVAMLALDGPAKPWKQLLVRRCPSLSWDKFVQELLQRFGDTITSGSCVVGNSSKYSNGNRSPVPQHRSPQPANVSSHGGQIGIRLVLSHVTKGHSSTIGLAFFHLRRFTRNANLIANGVAKNIRRVGNQIKQSIDDIMYPYRKRPK
ncbi:hypothetical protein SASPL_145157 [Salvia splendens]|uniref:Uncharacterized protein n=1 Tax=Salvia splendens TaxID=180675 RepID=A0A8X8WGK1_SALSN|nr:hypothetical protein SASPL_145157 [Salvia splendens]